MIKFYISYSIAKEYYDKTRFAHLDFYELIEHCKDNDVDVDDIDGMAREDIEEYLLDQKELDDLSIEEVTDVIKEDLNMTIHNNKKLFDIQVSDDYHYVDMVTLKYFGEISGLLLIDILEDYPILSICDTLGILINTGIISAFNAESESSEDLYISILFDKDYTQESMQKFETELRILIDEYNLTKDTLKGLNKILKINECENNK